MSDNDDLMIINRSGIIIRMAVADLRVMGRATQGVRLINIREGDAIASVARVEVEAEPEELEGESRIITKGSDEIVIEDDIQNTTEDQQPEL